MDRSPYSKEFYENLNDQTKRSAREIVQIVVQLTMPKSVIDVGCGEGCWLAEFSKNGIGGILSIDGDYVDRDRLAVPQDWFMPVDLRRPIEWNRKFDLAICLKVAEHLPMETAESFVDFLAGLAPRVLFSAAIPFQGGEHHVNEQWPGFFTARDYLAIDCIRKRAWNNDNVAWWYAQCHFDKLRGL
jgi:trans-aconitate methyltransferase